MNLKKIFVIGVFCYFLFLMQGLAQSHTNIKYNLDFNKYDPQQSLPDGWFKWGFYERTTLDSIDKNNYVGKLVSDRKGKFGGIAYPIIGYFKGDTIQLKGFMKLENVKGYAQLALRVNGVSETLVFGNMAKENISGTKDWQEYTIKLPYPDEGESINVAGMLIGKGTAWFDNFEVSIDGVNIENIHPIKKVELDSIDTTELVAFLKLEKKDLFLEEDFTREDSLEPVLEIVGDKRIVSIGEDTHGTSEFYILRSSLTKALIKQKGFNTIVLESPYDDIEILMANITSMSIEDLMKNHLLSIYHTEEMKSFLEWLKLEGLSMGVQFKGCDDSSHVLHELIEKEIVLIDNAGLIDLNDTYQKLVKSYLKADGKKAYKLGVKVYESLLGIEDGLEVNKLEAPKLKELLSNGKNSFINYWRMTNNESIVSRDEVMAERIAFLVENNKEKTIVWAHNAHISNKVIIDNEIGLMGHKLKNTYGDDYFSIGLSSMQGNYSFIENKFILDDHVYNDVLKQESLSINVNNSWERVLGEVSDSAFFLPLNKIKMDIPLKDAIGNIKLVGYGKETDEDHYNLSPFSIYDAFIFIKNTSATTPLFIK